MRQLRLDFGEATDADELVGGRLGPVAKRTEDETDVLVAVDASPITDYEEIGMIETMLRAEGGDIAFR